MLFKNCFRRHSRFILQYVQEALQSFCYYTNGSIFDLSVSKKETFSTSWTHQTLTGGKPGNNVYKLKEEPHEIDIFAQKVGKLNQHFLHVKRADVFQNLNALWL